jgi:RNA polymerase-associated protein LEO1
MSKDASAQSSTLAPGQVIRWRFKTNSLGEKVMGADGKPVRESNARFVKWSDGALQLVVGDEVFECTMNRRPTQHLYNLVQNDPTAALPDGALPISTDTTVFECVTTDLHGLKVQPSSLNSKLHAAKAAANKQKYGKKMKIVQNHGDDPRDYLNPEVVKARQIKAETALRRREAKQLRAGAGAGGGYSRPGMNSSFLDEDEPDGNASFDGGTSLKAIKAAARAGKALPAPNKDSGEDMLDFIVGDDDDDESGGDGDWEASKKRKVARGVSVLDSDDDDNDDDDDDDDDEEEEEEEEEEGDGGDDGDAPAAKKKQRTIIDSDEDDADE